ncbi:MAG TPA: hypothetical protein VIZ68_04010, partial [Thermoplasmata archaeon]
LRPSTIEGMAADDPMRALAIVRAEVRARPDGVRALIVLLSAEAAALLLSRLDLPGAPSSWAVWPRVEVAGTDAASDGPVPGPAV